MGLAARRSRPACGPASQRSTRRSRLGLVVPRVTCPNGARVTGCTVRGGTVHRAGKERRGLRGLTPRRPVCRTPRVSRPAGGTWLAGGSMVAREARMRRVAMVSVHTSPLEQPGTGDAGGLNVYVVETAKRLAERGVQVEVFTRATSSDLPPIVELAPGVTVRHVTAGPFEGLSKEDLPAQLCALTS